MRILTSCLRTQIQQGNEMPISPDSFLIEELVPFRHKIEMDFAKSMRSSFVPVDADWEHIASENELRFYQL